VVEAALAAGGERFVANDCTLGERDLGVKVGAAATVAEHRVADPAAMAAVLAELAVRRRGILSASAR